ncbi:unnamed protein product [Merluccius merluccius]
MIDCFSLGPDRLINRFSESYESPVEDLSPQGSTCTSPGRTGAELRRQRPYSIKLNIIDDHSNCLVAALNLPSGPHGKTSDSERRDVSVIRVVVTTGLSATSTSRAAFKHCLRWGEWCPFQEASGWGEEEQEETRLPLLGGPRPNPFEVLVYRAPGTPLTPGPAPGDTQEVGGAADVLRFRLWPRPDRKLSGPKLSLGDKQHGETQRQRRRPSSSPPAKVLRRYKENLRRYEGNLRCYKENLRCYKENLRRCKENLRRCEANLRRYKGNLRRYKENLRRCKENLRRCESCGATR